ncbi:hypothetical protein ACFQ07_25335, partial [Actinomadura adrarensis]
LGLAMALQGNPDAVQAVEEYTLPLTVSGEARLLHGIHDPRHAQQLRPTWPELVKAFQAGNGDVIADIGRVGGAETPEAVLEAADVVVMVLYPTLPMVDAARPRLEVLRKVCGPSARIGLCLVNDGPYRPEEVQRALDFPLFGVLRYAKANARVLSDGAPQPLSLMGPLLLNEMAMLGWRLRKTATEVADEADRARSALTVPGSAR